MAEKKKRAGKAEDYEKKIEELQDRIDELERGREEGPSMVHSVVGQFIPGLSDLVKTLEKSSPEFRQRIADTDAEIKHRIETGWTPKPIGELGISIRPMSKAKAPVKTIRMPRPTEAEQKRAEEKEPIIDVFEEGELISVIAELPGVPEKDIKANIKEGGLEIIAGRHRRRIDLPAEPGSIVKRTYKNGILHLIVKRKQHGGKT
jgi:HSP20 family protein